MSSQPPIIAGFQFDPAPIERGINTLIGLLDRLEQSASRAIGVVQGSGASVGGSAQEVAQFGTAIANLDANVGRIATTLQTFETRVDGIVDRLLRVPGAADAAGNALNNIPSSGGGGGGAGGGTGGGGGRTAGAGDQFTQLDESRARNAAVFARAAEAETVASDESSAADKRRVASLHQVEDGLDRVGQIQQKLVRAEALFRNAPEGSQQRARSAELLTRLLDQQSAAQESLNQKTIAAARTDQTLSASEQKAAAAEEERFVKGLTALQLEASKLRAEAVKEETSQETAARKQAAAEEERSVKGLTALQLEASKLRAEAAADLVAARNKVQDEDAAAAGEQAAFRQAQPLRVQQADAGLSQARAQEARATLQVAQATDLVNAAQKKGLSPETQAAATNALTTAEKALADAKSSVAAAQNRVKVVSDSSSNPEQVKIAGDLANTNKNNAAATLAHAAAQKTLASALKESEDPAKRTHDVLLAILGVSRFLPGELGRAVSGLGLLSGAMGSSEGIITGAIGGIGTALVKLFQLGAGFNDSIHRIRVDSEGLGLTVTQFKAIDDILKESGGSAEIFRLLIGNINEAISGIGPSADKSRRDLKTLLGDEFKIQGNDTFTILRAVIAAFADTRTGSSALTESLARDLAGRGFLLVKGAATDVNTQLDSTIKRLTNLGTTSKEVTDNAAAFEEELKILKERLEALLVPLAKGATFVVKLVTTPSIEEFSASLGNFVVSILQEEGQRGIDLLTLDKWEEFGGKINDAVIRGFKNAANKAGDFFRDLFHAGPKPLTHEELEAKFGPLGGKPPDPQDARDAKDAADLRATLEGSVNDSIERQISLQETRKKLLDKKLQNAQKNLEQALQAAEIDKENAAAGRLDADIAIKSAAQAKRALDEEVVLREQVDALTKQIADLKAKTKDKRLDISGFQLQREPLLENIQAFKPGTPDFAVIKKQILEIDDAIVNALRAAGGKKNDPELTRAIRQRFKDEINLNKEVAQQQRADFQGELERLKADGAAAIEDLRSKIEGNIQFEKILFESGVKGIGDLSKAELDNIARVAEEFRAVQDANIGRMKAEIATLQRQIKDPKSGVTFVEGTRQINELQKQIDAEQRLKQLSRDKETHDDIAFEENERQRVISARLELFDIETRLQQSLNARRLELLKRAAQDSILTRQEEIDETDRIEREQIQRQIDRVANQLRDEKFLRVNAVKIGNPQTGAIENILEKTIPQQLLGVPIQVVEGIIQTLRAQGADASNPAIKALQELIALQQQLLDLKQKTGISQADQDVRAGQRLLDIEKQRISLAGELLSIEESRLNFLEQEGLITKFQANEDRVLIERRRLDLLQQQARELERQRDLTVAAKAELQSTAQGGPVTSAQILEIQASPEVAGLNQELLKLKGEALAASDKLVLMDSVLGRVRSGLDILIDALDRAPEQFSEFSTAILQRSVKGLADAARGVQKLVDVILGQRLQKRSPAEEISDASVKFRGGVENAATNFKQIIQQAAEDFKRLITSPIAEPGLPSGVPPGTVPQGPIPAPPPPENEEKSLAQKIISKSFTIAQGAIAGLSAETIGGKIAGFGSIANAFGPIGAAVGAAASIVGGIADFIGSGFRKRAEKIAQDIQDNMKLITDQFRSGALSLGETTQALQTQLESARAQLGSGKISKKGGSAALKQIESSIQDQLAQLRQQAKDLQKSFLDELDLKRLAPDLRSISQAVADAEKKVTDFLRSFETGAEALKHLGEAQEFLNRSLEDLKTTATGQLDAIILRERDAQAAFEQQRQSIIQAGRVSTPFDQAQDRLAQLFDLEKKRAEDRAAAETEEGKLRNQINLIDASFQRAADLIDKMKRSFDGLTAGLSAIFGSGGGGIGAGIGRGVDLNSILRAAPSASNVTQSSFAGSLNIDLRITAGSPAEAARLSSNAVASTLERLGAVSRISLNRARPLA
jgi:hypothetical protein